MYSGKGGISCQGLNDRYFSIEKSSDIFRIAVVGDSTSYGWKVGGDNSFPKVLERMLNERKMKKYEVMNFSVPGYNIAQEYEILKEKVIKFHPDAVILVFCMNDLYICNWFKPDITPLNYLYNRSYFFRFAFRSIDLQVTNKLDNSHYARRYWLLFKKKVLGMFYPNEPILRRPGLEKVIYINENPPKERNLVPKKYWYMLGSENYRIHLSNIRSLLRRNNISLISCGSFNFEPEAIDINRELKIKYILDFDQVRKNNGVKYEDVTYYPEDWHMNERGHRLIAEGLYSYMNKRKLF